MATATIITDKRKAWTDEELEALPNDCRKYELLDGKLSMSPTYANHGIICIRIATLLSPFVQEHRLGQLYDSSTGFRLSPELLLSPDLAFVTKARLKKVMPALDRFLSGAPDLVVEVLSPSDRMVQIHRKLDHYFEHGTKLAWLINWRKSQIHIYTADSIEALTAPNDVLTGGEVLPGFKCKLNRIFRPV
jgi:Uma2 family endonuclease